MLEIDDLGRCESCGTFVLELELKGIEITDTKSDETSETLMCKRCQDLLDSLLFPEGPYFKHKRPERKTDV